MFFDFRLLTSSFEDPISVILSNLCTMLTWAYFSQVFMGVDVPLENTERMTGGFYRGSRILNPLGNLMNVPLDQINYVVSGLICFGLSQLMRRHFCPGKTTPRVRACLEAIFGLLILAFCFRNQVRVLMLQNTVAYLLMLCLPRNRLMAVLVTLWSMFYMALVHLCRLQYDYGGYTLDISGPVMVQTQRLSSLAFNLSDGTIIRQAEQRKTAVKRELSPPQSDAISAPNLADLNASVHSSVHLIKSSLMRHLRSFTDGQTRSEQTLSINGNSIQVYLDRLLARTASSPQRTTQTDAVARMPPTHIENAVDKVPSPIDFFSYLFYFHGSSVGPFVFYSEYQTYLEGYENHVLPPIDWRYLISLFLGTVACGLLSAYAGPFYPFDFVLTDAFQMWPLTRRIFYVTISLFLVRQKYYFAWGLSEVNGIGAGLGFTGYNANNGKPQYKKVRNFDFFQIEAGLGLKNVVDNWNISTTRWLRFVFYERLPQSCRTSLVFIISAIWHGFYPGYYFMFSTFAMFTFAARAWRRALRPLCRKTLFSGWCYDVFTTVVTNMAINYAQAPFHLLDFSASILIWRSFYFIPHFVALLILLGQVVRPRLVASAAASNHLKVPLSHGRTVGG